MIGASASVAASPSVSARPAPERVASSAVVSAVAPGIVTVLASAASARAASAAKRKRSSGSRASRRRSHASKAGATGIRGRTGGSASVTWAIINRSRSGVAAKWGTWPQLSSWARQPSP